MIGGGFDALPSHDSPPNQDITKKVGELQRSQEAAEARSQDIYDLNSTKMALEQEINKLNTKWETLKEQHR